MFYILLNIYHKKIINIAMVFMLFLTCMYSRHYLGIWMYTRQSPASILHRDDHVTGHVPHVHVVYVLICLILWSRNMVFKDQSARFSGGTHPLTQRGQHCLPATIVLDTGYLVHVLVPLQGRADVHPEVCAAISTFQWGTPML